MENKMIENKKPEQERPEAEKTGMEKTGQKNPGTKKPEREKYARSPQQNPKGLVHIYCGDGKGKTSAALGLALRAAGRGKKVLIARFLKHEDSGELLSLRHVPGITVLPIERSFGFVFAMDEETKKEAASYYEGLFDRAQALSADWDVLILDEIMAAVNTGMVPEEQVVSFLKERPEGLEVVMTGRNPSKALLSMADYVSEIRKLRHPYERGIGAQEGIEY